MVMIMFSSCLKTTTLGPTSKMIELERGTQKIKGARAGFDGENLASGSDKLRDKEASM